MEGLSDQTEALFFVLLRVALGNKVLSEKERSLVRSVSFDELYFLSKEQDLAHLVAFALETSNISLPEAWAEKFRFQRLTAVYRYERILYELERISGVFEEANIPYLPLKGAVLRDLYPEPWMRTSCDIDLLVPVDRLQAAGNLLREKLGYYEKGIQEHDVQWYAPNGVHLELHYRLYVRDEKQDALLNQVWEYTRSDSPSASRRNLREDFLVFYLLSHMAHHLLNGGCGVRPFLDLWLLRRCTWYQEQEVASLCERGGLLPFFRAVCSLSEVWFSGIEPTEYDREFSHFILQAGIYGNTKNRVAVGTVRKGGTVGYLLSRVFVSKESLCTLYPVLSKYPALFPLYQVRRWLRLCRRDRRIASRQEWRIAHDMDDLQNKQTSQLLQRLGL